MGPSATLQGGSAACSVYDILFDFFRLALLLTMGSFHICPNMNKRRMCGKGVGLGPFPSDSLESQSYNFDEFADIKPLYGVKRLLGSFLRSKSYDFYAIAHARAPLGVK